MKDPLQSLDFLKIAVGDDIGRPGYDGTVSAKAGNLYVPSGVSVWEMGTGPAEAKAEGDYKKRAANPGEIAPASTTFCFVSPHRWVGKVDWAKTKKAEGKWKDVRVYDNSDLESWLEVCPSVARWLAEQMSVPVDGLLTLDAYLKELFASYDSSIISNELIIGGRTLEIKQFEKWLEGESGQCVIEGESPEEAAAFIAAAGKSMTPNVNEWFSSKALFVQSAEAMAYVAGSPGTSFNIPLNIATVRRGRALVSTSTRLIIPRGRSLGKDTDTKDLIRLGHIRRDATEKAILSMGFAEQQSRRMAQESKGSLSAALWMIAGGPDVPLSWIAGQAALDLLPLLIAGQWTADSKDDRAVLEKLAARPYSEIERVLADWSGARGPLIRRGEIWDWRAWDFAWISLMPLIDRTNMKRFIDVAYEVLSVPDPRFELPADQRWAATMYGKRHPISTFLREGLIASIVQLGINDKLLPSGAGQIAADSIVGRLLSGANSRKVAWCSLSPWLPDFAEAAPDQFLKSVDELIQEPDAIKALFEEGGPFASSSHTYLLWSLERLAWSKDYFLRVIIALGRLAVVDPGGRLANRPTNSLTEILFPAMPQTTASTQERLAAVIKLYEILPNIGWQVATSCMPERGMVMLTHTASPQWRPWKPDGDSRVVGKQLWEFMGPLFEHMLMWAGDAPARWKNILGIYPRLLDANPELAKKALAEIGKIEPNVLSNAVREELSSKLQDLVGRHREFKDKEWAMEEEDIKSLEQICEKIRPQDVVHRYRWLFNAWPTLPSEHKIPFKERENRIDSERQKVVSIIWESGGLNGVIAFSEQVEQPSQVGAAFAELTLDEEVEAEILRRTLFTEPTPTSVPPLLQFGIGYADRRRRRGRLKWIEDVIKSAKIGWTPVALSNLGWALPNQRDTWDLVSSWGNQAEALYWQRVPIQYLENPQSDLETAVRQLMKSGRIYRALDLTGLFLITEQKKTSSPLVESDVLIDLLNRAAAHDVKQEWYAPQLGSLQLDISEILDHLESRGVEKTELVRLEWLWLPLLERTPHAIRNLQEALSESPELFVQLLTFVYRREDGTDDAEGPSENREAQSSQSYRLLHDWNRCPGASIVEHVKPTGEGDIPFDKGTVDKDKLVAWVTDARRLASECSRSEVADGQIGRILAFSPSELDGQWPSAAVASLIEALASKELEGGLEIGVYDRRGTYWRGEGGDQERRLAQKFQTYQEAYRPNSPRTSAMLGRIAEQYRIEAKRQDEHRDFEEFE
jgi:hypothetical protein